MIDLARARERMMEFLQRGQARRGRFGSALPGYREHPEYHLVIAEEREYEFGWAFFWNTKEFLESGNHRQGLVGNAPIIVDRVDGRLYVTGTAHSWDYYLQEYRSGKRRPAEHGGAANRGQPGSSGTNSTPSAAGPGG